MPIPPARVILYGKDIARTSEFYQRDFCLVPIPMKGPNIASSMISASSKAIEKSTGGNSIQISSRGFTSRK
jgi:hypothetical protein